MAYWLGQTETMWYTRMRSVEGNLREPKDFLLGGIFDPVYLPNTAAQYEYVKDRKDRVLQMGILMAVSCFMKIKR